MWPHRSPISARRAVVRWAWQLFRREWRAQALVTCLLTLTVAAAVSGGSAVAGWAAATYAGEYGSANLVITFNRPGPGALTANVDAAARHFGTLDVIARRQLRLPGLTQVAGPGGRAQRGGDPGARDPGPAGGLLAAGAGSDGHLADRGPPPRTMAAIAMLGGAAAAMERRGWAPAHAGWLVVTAGPPPGGGVDQAGQSAARVGLRMEPRDGPNPGESRAVRDAAVVAGAVLALLVLGLAVALIRSEAAGDLRVLLPPPVAHLLLIVIGVPLAAALAGWSLAGREPSALARRPVE